MPIVKDVQQIDGEEVTILIEVDSEPAPKSPYGDHRDLNTGKVVADVGNLFGQGLTLVRNCATSAVHGIKAMNEVVRPDEFEIQLAIKLDAEAGAVLAKAGAEAQMQVTMKWKREKLETRAQPVKE